MTAIKDILERFDMTVGSGLVFTDRLEDAANNSELLALHQASQFEAKAVYFRRFEERGMSMPQIYIYDEDFSDEQLTDIHRKLWSSGVVPLFYVITRSQIKIFSCVKSSDKKQKRYELPLVESISLLSDAIENYNYEKYSARLFDNGTFWEKDESLLDYKQGPYQKLLEGLLNAKKHLEQKKHLTQLTNNKTISKLLIMCVLVKYLEEKQDHNGTKLLEIYRDFYGQFQDAAEFTDILRKGLCVPFFEKLSSKFNGKVFELDDDEKVELNNANLEYVAAIFDAKIDGNQYVLWELYSFNHLPIELISGIYEAFLSKEGVKRKDVVYTPPYLVNFLIDECMPLEKAEELFHDHNFKVLDPACGSGIFLVSALKRMIQWAAVVHYKKTGQITYPDAGIVKAIIRNNIFGVDIEQEATLITIFSLCIALCDKLSPMEIWNNLRFDNLSETNVIEDSFFNFFNQTPKESFDLVIGNPPFNPSSGSNRQYAQILSEKYNIKPSYTIPGSNLAIVFWDKAILLCKPGRNCCLILPSGAWLYNNNSYEYRNAFLKAYQLRTVIDFTNLSEVLFHGSANVAVCAAIASNNLPTSKNSILHAVIKRTLVAEQRQFFEIDHYDFHNVPYAVATQNPYVWKANLLGGLRILSLINRLKSLRTLEEYLIIRKKQNGWYFGDGYKISHKENEKEEWLIAKNFIKANWITGHRTILTDTFTEKGCETSIERAIYFESPRTKSKKIYAPPHILIKKNLGEGNLPILFSEEYLCFKDSIVGIYSPQEDIKILTNVYERLIRSAIINRFIAITTSPKAGISFSPSVLINDDIMNLPYPEDETDLQLGQSEKIVLDDALNYFIKSGQSSKLSPLNEVVSDTDLEEFGTVFCNTLNPIYQKGDNKWFTAKYAEVNGMIVSKFYFGKYSPLFPYEKDIWDNDAIEKLERMIYDKKRRHVRMNRVLKAYLHEDGYDVLVLIKPNKLRYWLKSVALRDADETFSDLKRAGF